MTIESPSPLSRERIDQGRWVYSAWKHLRLFPPEVLTSFEATALAGKSCDLLGRLRSLAAYSLEPLAQLAKDCSITRRELLQVIIPELEPLKILQVARRDGDVISVRALVLSEDDIMDRTALLWATVVAADPVERGAIGLLRATADLPLVKEECLVECTKAGLSESEAERALELATAHQLVRKHHVSDFNADFYYNDFIWGANIEATTAALGALKPDIRNGLRSLLVEIHQHEGRPENELESAPPDLVEFAVSRGIVNATEITTTQGKKARFHFSPQFVGFGVSRDNAADTLDQVKLVIASFAFSTRYAQFKLRNPEAFLDKLIDTGYAGNASPIGTDYGAMERQKIVDVQPVTPGSSRYQFHAVKKDALIEARDTMRSGALLVPDPRATSDAILKEPHRFQDPVATRERARLVGGRPLWDQDLLAALRESAQKDGF